MAADVGVKGFDARSTRPTDTPTRVLGPVREPNVPAPTSERKGVVESIAESFQTILTTGIDTFRDVAIEAVPNYFAWETAKLQQGMPINSSPGIQRDRMTSEEIADAAQKGGSTRAIADAFGRADNTKMVLLIGGGILLLLLASGD